MKIKTCVLISVVLLGSSALAGVTHLQNTSIGLANAINLLRGQQTADAIQNLCVQNDQGTHGLANQTLFANFAEIGSASGDCSVIGLQQSLTTVGMQMQEISDATGPKIGGQSISLGAAQSLAKAEGNGSGSGLHHIVLRGEQSAANLLGPMNSAATILALQSSDISGTAGAAGSVSSVMNISTVQNHAGL